MSHAPNFQHDVFISYASADEKTAGLISYFADLLERNLGGKGVREDLSIFFDQARLESGKSLSDQILAGAESTAVMVAFHSPAYDESVDWCHREYREFVQANPNIEGRFFLIALDGGTLPTASPVFKDTADRHFRSFFTKTKGRTFSFSPARQDYKNPEGFTLEEEIQALADEIAKTLRRLRDDASAKRVFLVASDQFAAQARHLRDSLKDCDFVVLNSSPWIEEEARLNAASKAIERAHLVINIAESLNPATASKPLVHAAEQIDIAERLKKPRLQWLPNGNHGLSDVEIAALKTQGEVIASSLEEFKTVVVKRLTGPPPPPLAPPPAVPQAAGATAPPPFPLYISASDDAKGALADLVRRTTAMEIGHDGRVDVSLSNDPAAIETWCRQIKESIASFGHTAVIFIDGLCPAEWIDTRLRNYLVLERDLPSTPKAAVCNCLPLPKGELRLFRPPRVTILPCDDDAALRGPGARVRPRQTVSSRAAPARASAS